MYDVVTMGSASQDAFVTARAMRLVTVQQGDAEERFLAFDYPAKINFEDLQFATGGGATNAAVTFARFGLSAAFFGKLGDDHTARVIREELQTEGVDVSLVRTDAERGTGYSIVFTSAEGDRTILCYRGANNYLHRLELPTEALAQARWLYVSSLSGDSGKLLPRLADFAERHDTNMALNPGSAQIRLGLDGLGRVLSTLEVLCLNRREAALLTGIGPTDLAMDANERGFDRRKWAEETQPLMRRLLECGPSIVVITDGANGSCATDGERCWMMPAIPPENMFSSVGAGDAYASAFVAEIMRGGDAPRAMLLGAANATSVVQSLGAKGGILSYEDAEKVADANAELVEVV